MYLIIIFYKNLWKINNLLILHRFAALLQGRPGWVREVVCCSQHTRSHIPPTPPRPTLPARSQPFARPPPAFGVVGATHPSNVLPIQGCHPGSFCCATGCKDTFGTWSSAVYATNWPIADHFLSLTHLQGRGKMCVCVCGTLAGEVKQMTIEKCCLKIRGFFFFKQPDKGCTHALVNTKTPCTPWGGPATALLQPAPEPPLMVASPRHPSPQSLQCTPGTKRDRNRSCCHQPHSPQTPRVTKAGDIHRALSVIRFKDAPSCPALPFRSNQCVWYSGKWDLWHLMERSSPGSLLQPQPCGAPRPCWSILSGPEAPGASGPALKVPPLMPGT